MGIQGGHEISCIFEMFSFFVQVRAIDIHNFCVIFSSLMDHAANTKVVVSSDLFRLYSMWDSTVPISDLELSKSPPPQCQYRMGCQTLAQVCSRYIWGTKGDRNLLWAPRFLTVLWRSLKLLHTRSQSYYNRFSYLAYRSCTPVP